MFFEQISPLDGLRVTLRLWKLVIALWLVQLLLIMPVMLIVENALAPALANLSSGAAVEADLDLILFQVLDEIRGPAVLMLLISVVLGWLWVVVWHGGVVSWRLWDDSEGARLARILGHGLLSFWKFLRLSLASNGFVLGSCILVWWPLGNWILSLHNTGQETRMMQALGSGLLLTVLMIWVWRAAAIRAAWILGRHDRRSAVFALIDGFMGALAHPLSSLGTVALFSLLALGAGAAPLIIGAMIPELRTGVPALLISHLAAFLAAFIWLALFTTFAPVSGLLSREE